MLGMIKLLFLTCVDANTTAKPCGMELSLYLNPTLTGCNPSSKTDILFTNCRQN